MQQATFMNKRQCLRENERHTGRFVRCHLCSFKSYGQVVTLDVFENDRDRTIFDFDDIEDFHNVRVCEQRQTLGLPSQSGRVA